MTEIDLGADVEFRVKYSGKEYVLREPTVQEIEKFKDESAVQKDSVIALLARLGMPEETVKAMPVSKVKKLIDGLVEGLSQKK